MFFPNEQAKPYVMVVTSINQKGVAGYLLIPSKNSATETTNFISAADNPVSPASMPTGHESSGVKP